MARVHPTALYKALLLAGLAVARMRLRARRLADGALWAAYLLGMSAGRFVVERFPERPEALLGLTEAQVVCVGRFACGPAWPSHGAGSPA